MDRSNDHTPAALTPEGHEQSVSNGKGKQRNDGVSHYQGVLQQCDVQIVLTYT